MNANEFGSDENYHENHLYSDQMKVNDDFVNNDLLKD